MNALFSVLCTAFVRYYLAFSRNTGDYVRVSKVSKKRINGTIRRQVSATRVFGRSFPQRRRLMGIILTVVRLTPLV